MANLLTSLRVICGLLLLGTPAFSVRYYVLYVLGGITDAVDGAVARRRGTETAFGAKYDTAADFVFFTAVLIKIVRAISFPTWLLLWLCGIFVLKTANLVLGFIRYQRWITVHSVSNKVCGAVCFLLPFLLGSACPWQGKAIAVILACLLASAAAILESRKVWNGCAVA